MRKETYDVTGMTCSSCVRHVEKAVEKQPGVKKVTVNLLKNSMVVDYDENKLNQAEIEHAVSDAGYGAKLRSKNADLTKDTEENPAQKEYESYKRRLIWSSRLYRPADLPFDGTHAWLAFAVFLLGNNECHYLCLHAVPAASAGRLP